jgi:hypothetical protein
VKALPRRVGHLVALFVVFILSAGGVAGLLHVLGVSRPLAAGLGWATGFATTLASWRLWQSARRKREAALVARDRAAGEELRRVDRRRYVQLLEGATEPLAFVDPDLYVGDIVQNRPSSATVVTPPEPTEAQPSGPRWVRCAAFAVLVVSMPHLRSARVRDPLLHGRGNHRAADRRVGVVMAVRDEARMVEGGE